MTVRWQLPVIHTDGPEESLRVIRFLARQARRSHRLLRRYGRKPKRLVSRRTFFLQGLPGIGPELARRLLYQLGSVERIITADVERLSQVPGLGPKKAAGIRDLVSDGPKAPRTTHES